jgi:hypothetical protein
MIAASEKRREKTSLFFRLKSNHVVVVVECMRVDVYKVEKEKKRNTPPPPPEEENISITSLKASPSRHRRRRR